MLNYMYRLSVDSNEDGEREEQARVYFDEHGQWPEEEETSSGREWTLPAGIVTYIEAEAAARRAARDTGGPTLAAVGINQSV